MNITRVNPKADDQQRRQFLFEGNIFVYSKRKSLQDLTAHAQELITKAFGKDAEKAQYNMPVEEFVKIASALKTEFTNSAKTKELIKQVLVEFGCELSTTYFDVPRMRIVTSDNFLTAGVGYAYKAHRDTWYAAPNCQVNWWLPVFDIVKENAMSIYPGYWDKELKNCSEVHDYDEWCNEGRKLAASLIDKDNRKHPLPMETVEEISETRFVLASAEMIAFSAAHLHATAPNTSGKTRFSIDFRTVNHADVKQKKGAKNIDNRSTGTTLGDFFRASDLSKVDEQLVQEYKQSQVTT